MGFESTHWVLVHVPGGIGLSSEEWSDEGIFNGLVVIVEDLASVDVLVVLVVLSIAFQVLSCVDFIESDVVVDRRTVECDCQRSGYINKARVGTGVDHSSTGRLIVRAFNWPVVSPTAALEHGWIHVGVPSLVELRLDFWRLERLHIGLVECCEIFGSAPVQPEASVRTFC